MPRGRDKVVSLDAYRDRRRAEVEALAAIDAEPTPTPAPGANEVAAVVDLGQTLHHRGNRDGAEFAYRLALSIDPTCVLAAYNLGVALQDSGDFEEAIEIYTAALELEPTLADAHFNLAAIYQSMGPLWQRSAVRHLNEYRKITKGSNR